MKKCGKVWKSVKKCECQFQNQQFFTLFPTFSHFYLTFHIFLQFFIILFTIFHTFPHISSLFHTFSHFFTEIFSSRISLKHDKRLVMISKYFDQPFLRYRLYENKKTTKRSYSAENFTSKMVSSIVFAIFFFFSLFSTLFLLKP